MEQALRKRMRGDSLNPFSKPPRLLEIERVARTRNLGCNDSVEMASVIREKNEDQGVVSVPGFVQLRVTQSGHSPYLAATSLLPD